ncbi:MAG: response regulator [Smithellaceae bacterium]|nr:response regulator [Smithellaceae bacterium]
MTQTTILIVDDEEDIRKFMEDLFNYLGYRVILACDGIEAMREFTAHQIDCVISDICMPRMDGFEFLRQVRQRDGKVPFFLISGYYSAEKMPGNITEEVSAIISKPFSIHQILDTIVKTLPGEQGRGEGAETADGKKTFEDERSRRSGRDRRTGSDRRSSRDRRE